MTSLLTSCSLDHSRPLSSAGANIPSAATNPYPVYEYLAKECEAHRVVGPPSLHGPTNPRESLCVIPKHGQPGRWWLIVDLSFPTRTSINDGIDKDSCSLQYTTVDNATRLSSQLGQGTLMAKIDIASPIIM